MKKMKKRAVSVLLTLVMMITALPAMAYAKDTEMPAAEPALESEYLWEGNVGYPVTINNEESIKGATLVGATSSDPSVIRIYIEEHNPTSLDALRPFPLKPGSSVITLTYSLNGVQKSISAPFYVKKYPYHINSLTVNGHGVDCSSFKYYYNEYDYTGTKPDIRFVLNPGWKLDNAGYSYRGRDGKEIRSLDATLDFPQNEQEIWAEYVFRNSDGETIRFEVDILRPEKKTPEPEPGKNDPATETGSVPQEDSVKAALVDAIEWNGTIGAIPAVKGVSASAGNKKVTVNWKKATTKNAKKFDKVEIQVCPDKGFARANTKRKEVKRTKKSVTIKGLAKKKTYYVRVRDVKGSGTAKVVSKWSKTKKVKTK